MQGITRENRELKEQLEQAIKTKEEEKSLLLVKVESESRSWKEENTSQVTLIKDYENKINILIDENDRLSQMIQLNSLQPEVEREEESKVRLENLKEQMLLLINRN